MFWDLCGTGSCREKVFDKQSVFSSIAKWEKPALEDERPLQRLVRQSRPTAVILYFCEIIQVQELPVRWMLYGKDCHKGVSSVSWDPSTIRYFVFAGRSEERRVGKECRSRLSP